MKNGFLLFMLCIGTITHSQELPMEAEQQIETISEINETETEDDSFQQAMEHHRKHPLNLNNAEPSELRELGVLTDLQINNLTSYRKLFGDLLHQYEIQALPGWDLATIRKILPYVTIAIPVNLRESLAERMKNGENQLLLRISQVMEKSKGFREDTAGKKYLGSPYRVYFRYRYNYKNLLQFGFTGDKDAGEQFLKGAQKFGFDFYSFHFFTRKLGIFESVALGDFTVNLGQGLIHWQGMAFKKSGEITNLKRQSSVLRPYSSAGEFFFHRGIGFTIRKSNKEMSFFSSVRKLNANLSGEGEENPVSSFLTSGNNRTLNEIADKAIVNQYAAGVNMKWEINNLHLGVNAVYYKLSSSINKRELPYNLFSLRGNTSANLSIDYSYTFQNAHFFGEVATDINNNPAFVNGMLVSVDSRIDFSLLQRWISKGYQAMNANAFTEATGVNNEKGLFTGVVIRPSSAIRISAFADLYSFEWLRYRIDAPSIGRDYLFQVNFTPNKQLDWYSRYRVETKEGNRADETDVMHHVLPRRKSNWRTHINYKFNKELSWRMRAEICWVRPFMEPAETGFLSFVDVLYKPLTKPFSVVGRLQFFETDGYDSRLYSYENDVMYSYSVPLSSGKGVRYYINLNYDINKNVTVWLRFAQSCYSDVTKVGSGLDEIDGSRKTEIKLQARVVF